MSNKGEIVDGLSREVKFPRRLNGLMKKASELAVLCDVQVALIIFSSTGVLHQFSSCRMDEIISRYLRSIERVKEQAEKSTSASGVLTATEEPELSKGMKKPNIVEFIMEHVAKIQSRENPLLGKEDDDLNLEKVWRLVELINKGLVAIQEKTEKLLKEHLEQSRLQEQQYMPETEASLKEATNIREFFLPTEQPSVPYYFESDDPVQRQTFRSVTDNDNGAVSSGIILDNLEADNGDSDTTLQLGLPYRVGDRKRKEAEKETEFQHLP